MTAKEVNEMSIRGWMASGQAWDTSNYDYLNGARHNQIVHGGVMEYTFEEEGPDTNFLQDLIFDYVRTVEEGEEFLRFLNEREEEMKREAYLRFPKSPPDSPPGTHPSSFAHGSFGFQQGVIPLGSSGGQAAHQQGHSPQFNQPEYGPPRQAASTQAFHPAYAQGYTQQGQPMNQHARSNIAQPHRQGDPAPGYSTPSSPRPSMAEEWQPSRAQKRPGEHGKRGLGHLAQTLASTKGTVEQVAKVDTKRHEQEQNDPTQSLPTPSNSPKRFSFGRFKRG